MTTMKPEKIAETSMKAAILMFQALDQPKYTSKKEAYKKYKGLMKEWDSRNLLRHIPTASGKSWLYLTQELQANWLIFITEDRIING